MSSERFLLHSMLRRRRTTAHFELRRLRGRRGALVPRLRRPRRARRPSSACSRRAAPAGEDGLRLGHRLLEPLPALHEDLRLPRPARPGAAASPPASSCARPDLDVFVVTGDGDCCSIGAAHWIHAIRYNMNMIVMLLDNNIYGLTKKQTSPTTPQGYPTQHAAARQRTCRPLNPLDGHARRHQRVVRGADGRLDAGAPLRHARGRPTGTRASPSSASCSAARSGRRASSSDAVQDPTRTEILVHERRHPRRRRARRSTRRTIAHDPRDLDAARRLAEDADDGAPRALLPRPGATRATTRRVDCPCTPPKRRSSILEAEFDRHAV